MTVWVMQNWMRKKTSCYYTEQRLGMQESYTRFPLLFYYFHCSTKI